MTGRTSLPRIAVAIAIVLLFLTPAGGNAQRMVTESRDPKQAQDDQFAKVYAQWTTEPRYGSPLVDHLPRVAGIPTPNDVLGYYIGAPKKLTYYADILKYYRALAAATPRVKVETIGRSDEGRELVVVWVSSDENIKGLAHNRANLAKIADPRGQSESQINDLIAGTKPHYHLIGGLHSGETGPSEMLMELVYRLATETSPMITQIRNNVYVSVTPAAEPDGRDRNVDWFYYGMDATASQAAETARTAAARRDSALARRDTSSVRRDSLAKADSIANVRRPVPNAAIGGLPYWGKYVFHDNNRDINLSQMSMRAITDWYFTAHPPIMHDLHESLALLYTYSGGPPQNPNLDPVLFGELEWYASFELAQMTKWGMPGVYTHSFMDAWSPGYLGSVAYNHNGMMKMYETQSGRDPVDSIGSARPRATGDSTAGANAPGRGGRAGTGLIAPPAGRAGGPAPIPTGRGGGQAREWFRGIPVPPNAAATFSRRNNTNYMQTGVLTSLQLTSMFPNLVLENFYVKTRNAMNLGKTQAPYGYVFPAQRDMTRVVNLVNILRAQGIEIGTISSPLKIGTETFPSGSYVIKLDQPYGRLAKNLLEKQDYPDPALTTYDDSGWTMGHAFNVDVKEIKDKAVLQAKTELVDSAVWRGKSTGSGTAGLAVAHLGSSNMITFRYRLKNIPMKVAEMSFTSDGVTFPAGSFVVTGSASEIAAARTISDSLGLTSAALGTLPTVKMHEGDAPRIAIFSNWGSSTQELGWYRYAFDRFGIPFDLIFKDRLVKGSLKDQYDVILMAAQSINRTNVLAAPAAKPQPYRKSDKFKTLGTYGETDDMSGGFGPAGVDAMEKFLDAGGTLITTLGSVAFPIEFGLARTFDLESLQGINAQKPLIRAEIVRTEHPVFYGYEGKTFPIKYGGSQVFRVGVADQGNVLARYVGGDSAVLSGLMVGADIIKGRAFAVDVPRAHNGNGRVMMFSNNPIYRWQNHGEFNMVFNSILNWNDVPPAAPLMTVPAGGGGRGAGGPGGGGPGGQR